MSAWTDYATKVFREGQKKNPAYKFKDALKDAAKTYKKGAVSVASSSSSKTKKARKSNKRRTARRGGRR